ncbi:E4 SUMO-protein ligase PIAL1 [Brassica napus]|uniref:E4 SUMO-protein ligase PIAL1 n=1 Tax=Brassica napus TaxID=3708 RepID=UPI00207A764F|nr:E4 SUMO-protein ligase PIAL1 [Brassica napus]
MVIPPSSRLNNRIEVDSKEFHAYCFSLANRIDDAIGKDEVPADAQDLAITLDHVCQHRCNAQTRAVIMTLMISVKTACRLGWFPQRESQHLLGLVDSMLEGFTSSEDVASSVNSPISLIPQVMERFYPFLKLGDILVSSEATAESNILMKDFHISEKMLQHSPQAKVGLFVFRTEDISKSSCLIHPQEVSFLLNGKGVEKRYIALMEPGPQCPTDVTSLLNLGANLLQTVGCFGGSYFIVIALLDDIPLPVNPSLTDYSEVIVSNSDCDVIEGPSRISLSCPISRTRITLPVKGRVCKHLQCFDYWNYVEINTMIPSWRCPHCNQPVCYTDIRLDQKMIKILEKVGRYATDVVISADGSWKVLTEDNKNVEAVPEATQGDPNSFQKLTPTVLDLTNDENEMETSVGTQFNELKPCLPEIHNTHTPVMGYPILNQSSASVHSLPQLPQTFNVFNGQQRFTNFPQVVNRQDSAAREASYPQDRLATNTSCFHIPMPTTQSSQFQGSHVTPLGHSLGRASGYNHIYDNGITQPQLAHMPPPLHHQYAMQNQRLHTRWSRSPSPAQERPIPSGITHHQRLFANYGGTSYQRLMQRPVQRLNPVVAGQQFPSRELTNMNRMRGSLTPGSTGYEHMIIQPTRPVHAPAQTLSQPQPTAYNYIPAQAQVQTLPPPQPTANYNLADEIQAFLAHPSYPNGNTGTQAGTGSLPVEGVGPPGLFWSMPPEAW